MFITRLSWQEQRNMHYIAEILSSTSTFCKKQRSIVWLAMNSLRLPFSKHVTKYCQTLQINLRIMHNHSNQAFLVHTTYINLMHIVTTLTGCEEGGWAERKEENERRWSVRVMVLTECLVRYAPSLNRDQGEGKWCCWGFLVGENRRVYVWIVW